MGKEEQTTEDVGLPSPLAGESGAERECRPATEAPTRPTVAGFSWSCSCWFSSPIGSVALSRRLEGSQGGQTPQNCLSPSLLFTPCFLCSSAASVVSCCRTTKSPVRLCAGDGRRWSRTTPRERPGVGKKMRSAIRHAGRRVPSGSIQHANISTKWYVHQPLRRGIRVSAFRHSIKRQRPDQEARPKAPVGRVAVALALLDCGAESVDRHASLGVSDKCPRYWLWVCFSCLL